MTTVTTCSKLLATAFLVVAFTAPAAAQPSKSGSMSARLQARAVADGRNAARIALRDPKRARALIKRSLMQLRKAYSIALDATARSDKSADAFQRDAKTAMSFSSTASSEVDALLSVIDRRTPGLDRAATAALNRTIAMQSKVSVSLAKGTEGLDASTAASAVTALDLLATQQSSVTAGLVEQVGARGQRLRVKAALRKAIARSTKTEAALNAQLAGLAHPQDDPSDSQTDSPAGSETPGGADLDTSGDAAADPADDASGAA